MILRDLTIRLETYGAMKGSYNVVITVMENSDEIKLTLPPEMGEALVLQTKDFIHKFTKRAADQLHEQLKLATPEPQKQIGE
jgi:hypothetical protein